MPETSQQNYQEYVDIKRGKSVSGLVAQLEADADAIMEDFKDFMDGTRVLLLLQRHKEGGATKEHKRRRARFIVHNLDQMKRSLFELLLLKAVCKTEYRIYMTSAPRDIQRAEKDFKEQMLHVDFSAGIDKEFFWAHIEDKWISSLMSTNPMKDRGLFILDIDTPVDNEVCKWCGENDVEILKSYRTKNGRHFVVKPFDRTKFPKELGEVKVDGLLLLSY